LLVIIVAHCYLAPAGPLWLAMIRVSGGAFKGVRLARVTGRSLITASKR
jgi:hypothetical protein